MDAFVFSCLFVVITAEIIPFDSELNNLWDSFKKRFNKSYDGNEEAARRLIWEQNVVVIKKHNLRHDLGLRSHRLGLNKFSDMSHHEFVGMMIGLKADNTSSQLPITFQPTSRVNLPSHVDWRKDGLVTPVKDQGECSSSWAFSATGSLEGQHKKKTGILSSLSEQNLIDCSFAQGNLGCFGGMVQFAFLYIEWNGGIDTEEDYPYEARIRKCEFKREAIGATMRGFAVLTFGDEYALQEAVATIGPISVAIDANSPDFRFYRDGIYDNPFCGYDEDHAALVVGYGVDDGQEYWLVKNSWGESWGIKGYIKMSRNRYNQCGIASSPTYPIV